MFIRFNKTMEEITQETLDKQTATKIIELAMLKNKYTITNEKSMFQQVAEFTKLRLNAGKTIEEFVPLPSKPKALTKLEVRKFIGLSGV